VSLTTIGRPARFEFSLAYSIWQKLWEFERAAHPSTPRLAPVLQTKLLLAHNLEIPHCRGGILAFWLAISMVDSTPDLEQQEAQALLTQASSCFAPERLNRRLPLDIRKACLVLDESRCCQTGRAQTIREPSLTMAIPCWTTSKDKLSLHSPRA
jgi:hypothetical protein